MNKYIIIKGLILMVVSLNLNAQTLFASYNNTYIQKSYDIEISLEENDEFFLYIYALSLDDICDNGGFLIKDVKHEEFINALIEAKLKYQEWTEVAKTNNIKDFDKDMKINSEVSGYFSYFDEWHIQLHVFLTFNYRIYETNGNTKYILIIRTEKMQSSKNQYIDVDGFALVFTSADEIQEFVELISMDKINEFKNKPKADDLFKD